MDLKRLRTFVEVADLGTVSRAACFRRLAKFHPSAIEINDFTDLNLACLSRAIFGGSLPA